MEAPCAVGGLHLWEDVLLLMEAPCAKAACKLRCRFLNALCLCMSYVERLLQGASQGMPTCCIGLPSAWLLFSNGSTSFVLGHCEDTCRLCCTSLGAHTLIPDCFRHSNFADVMQTSAALFKA